MNLSQEYLIKDVDSGEYFVVQGRNALERSIALGAIHAPNDWLEYEFQCHGQGNQSECCQYDTPFLCM